VLASEVHPASAQFNAINSNLTDRQVIGFSQLNFHRRTGGAASHFLVLALADSHVVCTSMSIHVHIEAIEPVATAVTTVGNFDLGDCHTFSKVYLPPRSMVPVRVSAASRRIICGPIAVYGFA